jgi:hypothetical protein
LPIAPYDKGPHKLSDADTALAPLIQSTVWKVVSTYPYAGIAPEPTPTPAQAAQ